MIDNKCFTTEWIETKAKELNYSDTNLIYPNFSFIPTFQSSCCA